jgi:diaminopimelate epimerase
MLYFKKYQGCGNDFVIINNIENTINLNTNQIAFLCDRRFGIGADGFIEIINIQKDFFKMNYYNSDGNLSSLCGNGSRCAVQFCFDIQLISNKGSFESNGIVNKFEVLKESVKIEMNSISEIQNIGNHYVINTGSPHFVIFEEKIKDKSIIMPSREIRYSKDFPEGINVNWVEEMDNHLFVRTYERGVEDETYSCGTGVTASALVYANKNNLTEGHIKIKTKGGDFEIGFKKDSQLYKNVTLEGAAKKVFEGQITI